MLSRRQRHFGVIDIGSNSIRLVVYDDLSRAPFPRFNEKSFCALGAGLDETGRLREAAIAHAVSGQEHATERTACNLRQAWQSSAEVANGIVGVARRASESSEASAHALAASTELVRQAEKLSSEAESFLATVRAA